jgi:hypothetical protein
MTMRSTQDWSVVEKAQELADILLGHDDFLLPEKLDNREPERFVFDAGNLAKLFELWTSDIGYVSLKRRKPYLAWITLWMWTQESKRFNEIMAGFDERFVKKEDKVARLLSFAKSLYNWGAMVHGYICHEEDWNAKNYFGVPTKVTGGKLASTGGIRLEDGLPGIYWANFFGPLYVQFFSREKFRTVPARHKEELPDGGVLLLTAANPLDYGRQQARALEDKIVDHLGRDAFFEKACRQKVCRAPQFSFEQGALGHPIDVVVSDPVSKVIPDLKQFIQEAPALAEALVHRLTGKLDYSPESLKRVDDFVLKKSYRRSKPWAKKEVRRLAQQLTAYYGEVLRRASGGKWDILEGSGGTPHPAVVLSVEDKEQVEYPFVRVNKLWSERQRADGLAVRFHLLESGELKRLEGLP